MAPDSDELEERARIYRAAQLKLRKATLYCSGARAKVPKVKTRTFDETSPFLLPDSHELPEMVKLASAVPPGAHMDQFRMVTNPTEIAINDPDRTFINSTSMKEGLILVPGGQPPWYFGNQNKTKPADANYATMAASRYGFKGAQSIRQRHTEPYERPSNTRTIHTPHWLTAEEDVADEWVPPILNATFNTINGYESPKLWPENTMYPHGYPLKRVPTSHKYRRETTIALHDDDRPRTSSRLSNIFNRSAEKTLLNTYAEMERNHSHKSLPMEMQDQFARNWNEKVDIEANDTLRVTMNRSVPAYEQHTLKDPTDVIKYSGTTAFIVNTQSSEEVKFRNRLERSKEIIPYALRWKKIIVLFKGLRQKMRRDQDMSSIFLEMGIRMRQVASDLGASTILKRVDFMKAIDKVQALEGFDMKLFNAVYGAFDPLKKNIVRFVEILKSMVVLDNFEDSTEEKLMTLWDLNMEFGQDMSPFDIALTCLCNVCGSDQDHKDINELFRTQFKPTCYRLSITTSKIPGISTKKDIPDNFGDNSPTAETKDNNGEQTPVEKKKRRRRRGEKEPEKEPEKEEGSPILKSDQVMSALPAFNIIDNYLNRNTLIDALKACPDLYKKFDSLIDERLSQCYGSTRVKSQSKNETGGGATTEGRDFSWLIKKKKIKVGKGQTIARRASAEEQAAIDKKRAREDAKKKRLQELAEASSPIKAPMERKASVYVNTGNLLS